MRMNVESEFRQDLVTGDWIVIAPGRASRPQDIIKKISKKRVRAPKSTCPLENPQKHGNGTPILKYENRENGEWELQVIPNKFPAVDHKKSLSSSVKRGPYWTFPGIGHHDLIITRDHDENFPKLDLFQARNVFWAYQERYKMLAKEKFIAYVSMFHNWGPKAGASIYHPHYQMMAIPVVPPSIKRSLDGSLKYYKNHRKCVHCDMIDWEMKDKNRVVYMNDNAIVFNPFVSREPFEIRVFPRQHLPYFEDTSEGVIRDIVKALQFVLKNFEKNLHDPDYNFFIHTNGVLFAKAYRISYTSNTTSLANNIII